MILELDMAQVETLAYGVILLNEKGHIIDFNRAAKPHLRTSMQTSTKLAELIKSIQNATSQAPLPISSVLPLDTAADAMDIYLCRGGGKHFSLVFLPKSSGTFGAPSDQGKADYFSLLGTEIRHEITQFKDLLQSYSRAHGPASSELQTQCDRMSRLFIALDMLSRLHEESENLQGERLSFSSLVHNVLQEIPQLSFDVSLTSSMPQTDRQLGMVYGDTGWLKCMLRSLMEELSENAPTHCKVEIKIGQNGHFVVMSATYVNRFSTQSILPKEQVHPRKPSSAMQLESDLRRQLCKRIAVLHGGELKLFELDQDSPGSHHKSIDSLTLILPTGLPMQARSQSACVSCRFPKQAEVYARDLAALMHPSPQGAGVSEEEINFLSQLSTAHAQLPCTPGKSL